MTKDNWPNTRASVICRLHDANDVEAWNLVFDIYSPLVYQFCLSRGLQQVDALDVLQEVLAKLLNFQYQPDRGKFRAWLGTVVRNQVNLFFRKNKNRTQQEIDDEFSDSKYELAWERISCAHILDSALSRIKSEFTEDQWSAFEKVALRSNQDETTKQFIWQENGSPDGVARELNRSVQWVYNTKSKILNRLRKEIVFLAEEMVIL